MNSPPGGSDGLSWSNRTAKASAPFQSGRGNLAHRVYNEGRVDLRGWRLRGTAMKTLRAGPVPTTAALKRQNRDALNEARARLGLPPKPPGGLTKLSRDDPRVLAIRERLDCGATGRVREHRIQKGKQL